jgi:hypothetical protein
MQRKLAPASCIFFGLRALWDCLGRLQRFVGLRGDHASHLQAKGDSPSEDWLLQNSLASNGIGQSVTLAGVLDRSMNYDVTLKAEGERQGSELGRMAVRTAMLHVYCTVVLEEHAIFPGLTPELNPCPQCTAWSPKRRLAGQDVGPGPIKTRSPSGRSAIFQVGDAMGATMQSLAADLPTRVVFRNHARNADRHATATNQSTWIGSAHHCHFKGLRAAEGTKRKDPILRQLTSLVSARYQVPSSASREATTERRPKIPYLGGLDPVTVGAVGCQ